MQESKEQQHFFMKKALELGERGRVTAPPNPWIGSVIVQEGKIVGEGYHAAPGQDHAEVMALKQAGPLAKGSTVYVTLEPCAHFGRTPPCVNSLIEAKVKKVVIPFLDPDKNVQGRGVEILRQNGIEVEIGLCKEEAEKSLESYLYHRKTGKAFSILKAACSIDGRIAASDGSSQWITGEKARENAHLLRAQSQAILVGAGTALKDLPKLTVRHVSVAKQPLRVLLDRHGQVPVVGPLFDQKMAPTLVLTSQKGANEKAKEWEKSGIEWQICEEVEQIPEILGKRGILQVLVEGGARIHAAFFEKKVAQKVILYVGPCVLGTSGKPLFDFSGPKSIEMVERLQLQDVERFDLDLRLDYKCFF